MRYHVTACTHRASVGPPRGVAYLIDLLHDVAGGEQGERKLIPFPSLPARGKVVGMGMGSDRRRRRAYHDLDCADIRSHLLPLTTFNHHTHPLDQTPKDVTLRYTSTNMTTVPNAAEQQDQQPQVPKAILYSWQTSVWVSPS